MRLDRYLAQRYPFFSRNEWKSLCEAQQVTVNGRHVRSDYRIKQGDQIARWYPVDQEPSEAKEAELLADLGSVKIVNKPAGIPIHESGLYFHHTLRNWLAKNLGEGWEAVHRLDLETSGIVIVAKDPALRRQLSEDFLNRKIHKSYLAILDGVVVEEEVVVDAPIADDSDALIPKRVVDHVAGRFAKSTIKVLERAKEHTLVQVVIETGRTAQIRVHSSSLGHPVHHDKNYGSTDGRFIDRQALHAHRVSFMHPQSGELIDLTVPLPDDMASCWKRMKQ